MTKDIKNRILKLVEMSFEVKGLDINTCNSYITVSHFLEGDRRLVFNKMIHLNPIFTEEETIVELDKCFEYIEKIGGSENEWF